jgi:hypothetical protein
LGFLVTLFRYAAEPMQAKLVRKEGIKVTTPAGFFVHGKEGPPKECEVECAIQWAKQMFP